MTEDQSFQLPSGDNNLLGATSTNGIASGSYDFNKYDPYVERIRTLFVPSLESRIHSCLEAFVYRQESGQRSDSPYLKRCLDAAATLRDPVEAFCTKWRDSGLVETMLASVVKFLISNGPIDCFLNSIVLNNRLNKVCRDLDALGVEKDLLRYLAVWNYINERDYWLEEDKIISTSKSDESRDSVDRRSDLAVEVGSGLDSRRDDRSIGRAFKRRATDDSSDDKNQSSRASQNFPENPRSRVPFPSRLSIDSSNPEGSRSSSARKKIRTSQAHPCRPATCPTYRAKNPAPVNWEGKTLRLQLCKTSDAIFDRRECRRSSELSELELPCKFDDLIAGIFKAHPTTSRRFKFKAGATSVCSRLNETLGRIDRKEVGRCRLHCEILPGCVGFRLIERDRDGSEVCLFSDRVPIDRIDALQRNPRRSSGSEPRRIGERQNADEAELTMYKNSGFSPADEESRNVGSREVGAAIETEPEDILLRLTDVDLEASDRKYVEQSIEQCRREGSNRSSEDKVGEAACDCNTSFDDEACQRKEDNEDEGFEQKTHPRERSLNRSNGNAIADDRGDRDDKLDRTAGNEESNEAANRNNVEDLTRGESSIRSNGNPTEGQKCICSVPTDYTVDHLERAIEADRRASGIADWHEEIADAALEDAAEKDRRAKLRRTSSGSIFLKNCQPDVPADNRLDRIACEINGALVSPSDELQPGCGNENQAEECDSKCSCDSCSREDEPRLLKKTEVVRMSSLLKRRTENLDSPLHDSPDPNSTQRNETLASGSDEFQCGCANAQSSGFHSQDLEFRRGLSMNIDTRLETNATETALYIEADSQRAQPDRGSAFQQVSSATNKRPRNLSSEEHPVVSSRLSLNNATKTMSFMEADSQRAKPDRGSAFQQVSSATNKRPRNLSSEEHLVVSSRLSLNNATKTMSFMEADSQRAQPGRGSAVQQASPAANKRPRNLSSEEHPVVSARLSLKKYQPHVPTDNQLDKAACACPSDCTCPNRSTEENRPAECDSQCSCDNCHQEDESRPLKKTEIIRMSSLPKRHTETSGSAVQGSADPTSTLKNGAFLVSASDESQRGCTKAQTSSFHTQDLELHEGPSMKSDSPLESNAAETMSFIESESPTAQPDRDSAVQRTTSATNKSRRNVSSVERPIVASRLSRPKGQRINISIEVCPESESSSERTRRNYRDSTNDELDVRKDATSLRKPRRHSVEPQHFERHFVPHPGKDTGGEFLGQPGSTDAGVRSPPRPLEFRDYLPLFRPPSSMRNPIVYGTSRNTGRRSIGMDVRSASQGGRRRGDSCVTKNRHGSIQRKNRANDQEEMPEDSSRLPSRPDAFFPSGLRKNVGHALSAGSVDRMKHLIRTKLRRMLLERDKATNTPKTTLTNKKYRVSVPGGKTDRSHFGQQPCRTIWESRSASDSVRTSRSFASDDCTNPDAIHEREKARRLFRSTGNPGISASRSRDCGGADRRFDGVNSSRNSESARRQVRSDRAPEVDSETDFPRLAGGSDFGSKRKSHENMHWSGKRENQCARRSKNGGFDEKFMNYSRKEVSDVIGDSSAGNSCDASGKKIPDAECAEFYGILREAGNERAPEVGSENDFPRLTRGSDFGSKRERQENRRLSGKWENQCARRSKNGGFDEKFMNRSRKEVPEVIGDSSAGNSCDASRKKIPDESAEFHGILRVAGNERAPEVDSKTDFPRLAGGSDFGSKTKRDESTHSSGRRENRCASQNKNTRVDRFEEKFINHSFKEVPEEIGVSSAGNSRDASGKKILDESSEFYGKLDWSGNSTSRHICLFEFDRLVSSNDETESADCCHSPRKTRLPEVRRTPRRNVDAHPKKLIVSRARDSRPSAPRDKSAMNGCSSNTNNVSVSGVRRIGAFGNIDQDLRKKLSQYVSLCKNVKYSLLKRLRPDDIYEVSRTSIPCCDRYKFGDT